MHDKVRRLNYVIFLKLFLPLEVIFVFKKVTFPLNKQDVDYFETEANRNGEISHTFNQWENMAISWTDNHLALAKPRASKARQKRCQEEILAPVNVVSNNFY